METLRRWFAPPTYPDRELARQAKLLHSVLWAGLFILLPYSLVAVLLLPSPAVAIGTMAPLLLFMIGMLMLNYLGRVTLASRLTVGLLVIATILGLVLFGLPTESPFYATAVVAIVLATFLVSGQAGIIVALLTGATALSLLPLRSFGIAPEPMMVTPDQQISIGVVTTYVLVALVLSVAAGALKQTLMQMERDEAQLAKRNQELDGLRAQLETLVGSRTEELERRAEQLRAAAEIGRAASDIYELDILLPLITRLISESFGFYHTGIFLLDDAHQYAVLRAANSTGGQRMLERQHRLRVGSQGIVGFVTDTGLPRVALDVGDDAVFFNNPDLPDTRSEMALPLMVRGEIIGALDVQSTQPSAFSDDDIDVLTVLTEQVGMAINNARLFAEVQTRLEAERRAYGDVSSERWQALLQSRQNLGYTFTRNTLSTASDDWPPDMRNALETGQVLQINGEQPARLVVPLRVRGQLLGALSFQKEHPWQKWQAEEIELLSNIVDQLGAALESARLYDETQRRAARERTTADISGRIRETLDIETMLRTTVEQVRTALGLPEVSIQLTSLDQAEPADQPAAGRGT